LKSLILVGPEFEDEEYIYPYHRFQEAGILVNTASLDGNIVYGKHGIPARVDTSVLNIDPALYDMLFIPGGLVSPDKLRQNCHVLGIVRYMFINSKPIAAICHGPWVMISAGIMRGIHATCYPGMKDDLINAGAIYQDAPVVCDEEHKIVTAPHYRNNADLMREFLKRI